MRQVGLIRGTGEFRALVPALCAYAALHAVLLPHDLATPAAFLAFDRAEPRLAKIEALIQAPTDALGTLIRNAGPGDYVIQALPYAAAGRMGVIVLQLLLGLLGLVFTFRLARLLLRSTGAARAVSLLYVMLPGSLWVPHVLSSEAIVNPLIPITLYYICAYAEGSGSRTSYLAALALFSVVLFVRPQFLLFPIVLIGLGFVWRQGRSTAMQAAPAIAYVLPLCWAAVLFATTGSPLEPASDHDLSATLAERIGRVVGADAVPGIAAEGHASPAQFLAVARTHPAATLKTYLSDAANFCCNPGFSGLSDYLGWFGTYRGDYWTKLRDSGGYGAVAKTVLTGDPGYAAMMIGGLLAWAAILVLAVCGCSRIFTPAGGIGHEPRAIAVAFMVYTILVVFTAGNVRWTHRTPLDCMIATLAVAGVQVLRPTRGTTRPDVTSPPALGSG